MNYHIIIPARYHSSRLPGKVLREIQGKPLIQYVYERAELCGADSIIIATDDERVQRVAEGFGATVCMTETTHERGSDRLAEVVEKFKFRDEEWIVNLQGDEPLVPPEAVRKAVLAIEQNPTVAMTTLCTPIQESDELHDPNCVKVVFDKEGHALYFSRSLIPYDVLKNAISNEISKNTYFRHIGLYTYKVKTLKQYKQWGPSPLEISESLEQLRVLWQGEKIHVSVIQEGLPPGIDTEVDLMRFTRHLEELALIPS